MHNTETQKKVRITKLYEFDGLQRVEVKEASVGSIVALSGIEDIYDRRHHLLSFETGKRCLS